MSGFLDIPQTVPWRRALFTLHLWLGLAVGLYLVVVCTTGALLVFRIDMQRALYPELLEPQTQLPVVDAVAVIRSLEAGYPQARISGVDAPTTTRPVFLAYAADASGFRTILIDPGTARILGELPASGPLRTLQDLHFNLLLGKSGKVVNGIGALCLLALCLTGAVIWWQGRRRWTRGFRVRTRSGAAQFNWDLHSATGFWMFGLVVMWAVTALYFTFPAQFRAVLGAFSTPTPPITVQSAASDANDPPALETLLQRAQEAMPGRFVARVVLPARDTDAIQVFFAGTQPTPTGPGVLTPLYLDRHTGRVIDVPEREETLADSVLRWVAPLHVGNFGGTGTRIAWSLFGLSPALLFVTGFLSWWRRVARPALRRRSPGLEAGNGGTHVVGSVD